MLFNVCDGNGKHLGILTYIEAFRENLPAVVLTDLNVVELPNNQQQLMERLAQYMDCKTLLGKVNEAKLEEKLREAWVEEFAHLGSYDRNFALKLMLLKKNRYNEFLIQIDPKHVKGYILLDKSDVKFKDKDTIIMEEELNYIPEELEVDLQGEAVIFGEVADYPVVSTSLMGVGEGLLLGANLSDFGGRNHSHYTHIKFKSGNLIKSVDIAMPIYLRKGMSMMISMNRGKTEAIFVDGVIYRG